MKFHFGPVPDDETFAPDEAEWHGLEWHSLTEAGPIKAQVLALPIMLVTVVSVYQVLTRLAGATLLEIPPLAWLVVLAPVIVLHEFAHTFFHPGRGGSSKSVLGFWPGGLVFYAHYLGPLPRNRFMVILLAPFVVLTVVPVSAGCLVGWIPWWAGAGALINAAAACVDLLGFFIMVRIPPESIVRNKGWKSYWRPGA